MQMAILVLIGLGAGMSSGLFGIGGGVLIVPALVYLLDFPLHRAVGTSLAVLLPPIGAAAVRVLQGGTHRLAGRDHPGSDGFRRRVALGSMVANQLNENWLRTLFGVFLIALGGHMLFFSKSADPAGRARGSHAATCQAI